MWYHQQEESETLHSAFSLPRMIWKMRQEETICILRQRDDCCIELEDTWWELLKTLLSLGHMFSCNKNRTCECISTSASSRLDGLHSRWSSSHLVYHPPHQHYKSQPLLEPGLELGQDHIKEQALEQTRQSYLFSPRLNVLELPHVYKNIYVVHIY